MHNEDGVGGLAVSVFDGFAEGGVVHGEGREGGLTALEGEIGDFEVPFCRVG